MMETKLPAGCLAPACAVTAELSPKTAGVPCQGERHRLLRQQE